MPRRLAHVALILLALAVDNLSLGERAGHQQLIRAASLLVKES